jgi:hydroxymethylpyrimidine/phosphomethylpyrimidine kinase
MTIAGSDSGGGAGIQADLKTFATFGVYGTTALTAVTAQNTVEVREALALPAALVAAQIETVLEDINIRSAKTGMLANAEIVEAVASAWAKRRDVPLVVDPVIYSTTGFALLDDDAAEVLCSRLLPLATLVTPNLREAERLTGTTITSDGDMERAGAALLARGAAAVLIKGGHLADRADDLLVTPGGKEWLRAAKLPSQSTHGTGCSLSAAIAAGLAHGLDIGDAVRRAKRYVSEGIRYGYRVGAGAAPINHFFEMRRAHLEL